MALKHNPDNEEAKHALSALVADPTVTTASTAYITSLFDEYAATFDKALVQDLNYTAPQKIHEVVSELAARSGIKSFKTVVDVGCGTGLVELLHHPHRPAPGHIGLAVEQAEHGLARGGRAVQLGF